MLGRRMLQDVPEPEGGGEAGGDGDYGTWRRKVKLLVSVRVMSIRFLVSVSRF